MSEKVGTEAEDLSPRPPNRPSPTSTRKRLRWGRWLFGFLIVAVATLWLLREPITVHFEKILIARLKERGVYLRYAKRSWLPWRGLRLQQVELDRDAEGHQPVVELSELAVDLAWFEIVKTRSLITRWRTKDATITLRDSTGPVTFAHVYTKVMLHPGEVEIVRWDFQNGPLAWTLMGKILLGPDSDQPPPVPPPFSLDLTVVRGVLGTLDIKPGTGPLGMFGNFSVDLRNPEPRWDARLNGSGNAVEWSGVPMQQLTLESEITDHNLRVNGTLQLTKGSAKVTVTRSDWDKSPLDIRGTLTDAQKQTDTFQASENLDTQLVTISELSGPAHLLDYAHNFPAIVPALPKDLTVRKWPNLVIQNSTWSLADMGKLSIGSIELKSPADLTIARGAQPVRIDGLAGHAIPQAGGWKIQAHAERIATQSWALLKTQIEGETGPGKNRLNAKIGLPKGSADLTVSAQDLNHGPWAVTGSFNDAAGQTDQITGRVDANAGTTVTKLEGPINLVEFANNFPSLHARLPAGLQIRKFPDLLVKDFTWHGGTWSVGSLQLRSGANLTATVKGHPLVVDELTGGSSYNGKSWHFSRLTGQALGGRFTLDGLYADGLMRDGTLDVSQIRMKQLSPWYTEQGTLEEAILSLHYRGTLGDEPTEFTGAGTINMENAPLVKVPLLDETYAIFSAFNFKAERHGPGSLRSTFTVQKGVFDVTEFAANSEAIHVTAKGKIDLVKRQVSARAWANLRGVAGVVTKVISRTLEMEVSGPLDNIRVRPAGPVGIAGGGVVGAAETTGKILKEGVMLPFKPLGWFKQEPAKPKP